MKAEFEGEVREVGEIEVALPVNVPCALYFCIRITSYHIT